MLKMEIPPTPKQKAIEAVQDTTVEEPFIRLNVEIPAPLKLRLLQQKLNERTSLKELCIRVLTDYLEQSENEKTP